MDYDLDDQQTAILNGLEQLLHAVDTRDAVDAEYYRWSPGLDAALENAGFVTSDAQLAPLEAALVIARLAELPLVVEASNSLLLAPQLMAGLPRPIAVTMRPFSEPIRYLPIARTLVTATPAGVVAYALDDGVVAPVETLFAYPYGQLRDLSGITQIAAFEDAYPALLRRYRIAIAAEAAGLMSAARDCVHEYVLSRQIFGKQLASYQAVQHRLVNAAEVNEATRWLALRAAWSDAEDDAATACTYAQDRIAEFTYDLHQFCGAMGLTTEFSLHFWTYRLRALMGELGGCDEQARSLARLSWN